LNFKLTVTSEQSQVLYFIIRKGFLCYRTNKNSYLDERFQPVKHNFTK